MGEGIFAATPRQTSAKRAQKYMEKQAAHHKLIVLRFSPLIRFPSVSQNYRSPVGGLSIGKFII